MQEVDWYGCYDDKWGVMITKTDHASKFSRSLVFRIIEYFKSEHGMSPCHRVIDPFGGIGTGGIACTYNKIPWFGVELERKYAFDAKRNFRINDHIWKHHNFGHPCLTLGDSRRIPFKPNHFDFCITSPPFGENLSGGGIVNAATGRSNYGLDGGMKNIRVGHIYGEDQAMRKDNIILLKGTDWEESCAMVYKNVFQCLKTGGKIAVVVKDFVKKKKIFPVCDNTTKMLSSTGFNVFLKVKAMQVSRTIQKGLFGEDIVDEKNRKSMFKIMAENKGCPKIDYEMVIFGEKLK